MQQLKERVRKLIKEYPHVLWGLYVPVYLAMYFTIEKCVHGPYWYTQLPIDYQIPFVEQFVVFYDIWLNREKCSGRRDQSRLWRPRPISCLCRL